MASPDLTAAQVMDAAAARLNDVSKTIYTYTIQIPFLNIALRELQELFELNNVPVTDETSAVINVPSAAVGVVEIGYTGVAGRILPSDLIELKVVWQSTEGLNQFTRLSPLDYLPPLNTQISSFNYYQWADQKLRLLAANADNDLKLEYIKSLFAVVTVSTAQLNITNGFSYLSNRVASLIANDIEEDEQRAADLLTDGLNGLDRALGITTKGRQKIQTRRLPFRAGYKSRNSMVR
jgi:hypothetical protein